MKLSSFEEMQMLKQMQEGLNRMKESISFYENISIKELLNEIAKNEIYITEEDILSQYETCFDSEKVNDYFYERDMMKWDRLDDEGKILNSDALYYLIDKIIVSHYDTEQLCDPHYILMRMNHLKDTPKNIIQDKVLGIITSIVEYGQFNNVHYINEVFYEYDMNQALKEYIRKCHNRDSYFKQVIKSYYDTYEDADRTIYKLK